MAPCRGHERLFRRAAVPAAYRLMPPGRGVGLRQHDDIAGAGQPQGLGDGPHGAGQVGRATGLLAGEAVVAGGVVDEDFPPWSGGRP